MGTTIDQFGRIVIPKTLRNNLGIEPGVLVDCIETENGVLIRASKQTHVKRTKEGVLVFTGKFIGDPSVDYIKKDREERIKHLSRLK